MADLLALLALPCLAGFLFVGIHTWFGLQVLRRNVVFADLALAQLSALGATGAVAVGHAPGSVAGFIYAFAATLCGAFLLTVTRRPAGPVSQEAIIGIIYVLAAALTVLVVDRSPQGAEHVKRMLVGNILTVTPADVLHLTALYGGIGLVHAACWRWLLASAHEARDGAGTVRYRLLWDFVFYATFGLVVTSSVAHAGVLLVFSFLIIPAVIGTTVATGLAAALGIGWASGALATLVGLAASVAFDLPTGPTLVAAFGLILVLAWPARALLAEPGAASRAARRRALRAGAATALAAILAQSLWLMAAPAADQPLLALIERAVGFGPETFMTPGERTAYADAASMEQRNRTEVERLRALERDARWQGTGLAEEELRRIASYQQTFNEMGRGERFVQDHLRARARARQRWWIGLPAAMMAGLGLGLLFWPWRGRAARPLIRVNAQGA